MLPTKWYLLKFSDESMYVLVHEKNSCDCPYQHEVLYGDGDDESCKYPCGSWCPLFEITDYGKVKIKSDIDAINETVDAGVYVTLHCGSGQAEYKIEEIKGE